MIRIGLDVGSTTAKMVVLGHDGQQIMCRYERHAAQADRLVAGYLAELEESLGDVEVSLRVTGSVGMGLAERCGVQFVQEVVAATVAVERNHPEARAMIDIGGEDAKVVLFRNGEPSDLRMNGNCAGGTGAFIDQMAVLLGVTPDELGGLAERATRHYPMASRCGVFSKTDVQNLVARGVPKQDIAASIFHAVAVQTVSTLAHGCDIESPVVLCGGPLGFIPALRRAFAEHLGWAKGDMILPKDARLLPALGAALYKIAAERPIRLSVIRGMLSEGGSVLRPSMSLPVLFASGGEYDEWRARKEYGRIPQGRLAEGEQRAFLGVDSGSTTTKIVLLDTSGRLLYTFYRNNGGNPVGTVREGLELLAERCAEAGTDLRIVGSCSTGYGEELIKAAFGLHGGVVETVAHYMAARRLNPEVSFILDIGGQDMKAIFVSDGVIDRIEINEACSSGCGSFIETFARTLGYTSEEFARAACRSKAPCDLGTRCTVFMNSKVKQVLREGATVDDIAAGLAYSVVRNCLHKVLKLSNPSLLGRGVVVQGGTMRNDAVVRALEMLTSTEVMRCDIPELMGAYGSALLAMERSGEVLTIRQMLAGAACQTDTLHCHGCTNRCEVRRHRFAAGGVYYSGNKCEKVFGASGRAARKGRNAYSRKLELLFEGRPRVTHPRATVGIPRCLNMWEEYPFWHTLFTECGIDVVLSPESDFAAYERSVREVMSDNICFPAKLAHSHIEALARAGVDRVFMPFVVFERRTAGHNSYNCPVVTGYSEVIRSVSAVAGKVDSPTISFKERGSLLAQCCDYLAGFGVERAEVERAFVRAESEQLHFEQQMADFNRTLLETRPADSVAVLLAGRPYHADPLVNQKASEMLAAMGVDVLTDDVVRGEKLHVEAHYVDQWSFPGRIMRAAEWCAQQTASVQFVQMTSFGCGPDAFLVDEVREVLSRRGKALTLLKLDDINSSGSMRLRARSMLESVRLAAGHRRESTVDTPFVTTPVYTRESRDRVILMPFFTPFISPLLPDIVKVAGYRAVNLPMSDPASGELGLRYANNEVCYPATLVVGDILKALKSGSYDHSKCVVAMTQTGGQCRASNYLSLIKRAMVDAGVGDVPVISLMFGGDSIGNPQPGFSVPWLKVVPVALRAVLFSDCIAKFYYATVVREREQGAAERLKEHYLATAAYLIGHNRSSELLELVAEAAQDFDSVCSDEPRPRVGVVGEIYLKFNPYAHRGVVDWLVEQQIEVVPPVLTDFFMQAFVNRRTNVRTHILERSVTDRLYGWAYRVMSRQIARFNRAAGVFRHFVPFGDIFEQAEYAQKVITLSAQFGEGWLLPAEVLSYARMGVPNVVSLQPFGCIANHIVARGVEKRIKNLMPEVNLLSLDFDSGVSDVNITNRMLLFIEKLKSEYDK